MIRVVALIAVTTSVFMACPPMPGTDGGVDSGTGNPNPNPIDACSGGCAENQICDADGGLRGTPRTCVDGCGGCDAGTCRLNRATNTFSCVQPVTTCNGAACAGGQSACVSNECSCLVSARSTQDTCQSENQWCRGKTCGNPVRYEECSPGSTAACPTGEVCVPLFDNGKIAICLKDCRAGENACDVGELCRGIQNAGNVCLPDGLVNDCSQHIPQDGGFDDAGAPLPTDGGYVQLSDGGFTLKTVPVGNSCLVRGSSGVINDTVGKGRGNCTYASLKFWRFGLNPIDTCVPPGTAALGDKCSRDFTAGTQATRCGTGLECAYTGGATDAGVDEGVCLKTCNANPGKTGFVSQPACGGGESCVNLYRYTDPNDNAVLGVCMKNCNVFSPTASTCANLGPTPTSCVPASADGQLSLTLDGAGICVPQQKTIANAGDRCANTDTFRGATCGSGQVCSGLSFTDAPTCTPVCDLSCNVANPPARCMNQPNARCANGKTCRRASSTTGATVGYCL